jgi:fused signal recognition particle receptor
MPRTRCCWCSTRPRARTRSATGIVLAKLDGTAKGGVILPIREKFAIPVKFIGVGEKASDLAVFNAEQFAAALFAEAA